MVSVTKVLDYFTEPELLTWYLREGKAKCQRISDEAKRIGIAVDLMIQADLKGFGQAIHYGLTPVEQEAIANCFNAWQRFKEQHPEIVQAVTGIQMELTDGEIVGHPDLEITQVNRWGIIDIKTSKAIQPKHWTQVAAYLMLKVGFKEVKDCFVGILRLDKVTGFYEYKELTDPEHIFYEIDVFRHYWGAYRHGQQIREVIRQLAEKELFDVA